uniref:Arf-GAP domain-containing protein n=1 Tax=Corethron hystrix TaxID=216773 RepID=A0A6U5KEP5_9STRA|mmetsp:Transcript_40186/g.94484  ORF Transcript_40186/g.94484 Transcript_40186/m.94484 type:complete len:462 (+) Transcript_40186:727-2112(+)
MPDQQALKKRLNALLAIPSNQVCSDCPERQPRWASIIVPPPGSKVKPMGALCCLECSGSHRRLGVHISFVRSINLDSWNEAQVVAMEQGGNKKVNMFYEALLKPGLKLQHGADGRTREKYIRDKYERRKFYDANAATSDESDSDAESDEEVVRTPRTPSSIAKRRAAQKATSTPITTSTGTTNKTKPANRGRKIGLPRAAKPVVVQSPAPEVDLLDFSSPVQTSEPIVGNPDNNQDLFDTTPDMFSNTLSSVKENTTTANTVPDMFANSDNGQGMFMSNPKGHSMFEQQSRASSDNSYSEAAESNLLRPSQERSSGTSENLGKGIRGMFQPKASKKTSDDIMSLYNQAPQQGVYNMGSIGVPQSGALNTGNFNGTNSAISNGGVDLAASSNSLNMQQRMQQQQFMMMQQFQFQQQMGMMSPMQMQMQMMNLNGGCMMPTPQQQLQFKQMQKQQQQQQNGQQ